jgi:hypothetical protein
LRRDYLNHTKWLLEKHKHPVIIKDSDSHRQVEAAIKTYFEKFNDQRDKYYNLVFPMYQEALELLGKSGLPFENRKVPPFCVALGLAAAMGKDANEEVKPKKIWFVDQNECIAFFNREVKAMLVRLGTIEAKEVIDELSKAPAVDYEYNDDLPKLLESATNAIHLTTGMLR